MIEIKGVIGYDVKAIDIFAQIQSQEGDVLDFLIDSEGGDVDEGFLIAQAMRNSGKKVRTYGRLVASIAVICFLAGDERIAYENSSFMIHQVSVSGTFTVGTREIDEIKNMIVEAETKILNYYQARTGVSSDKIKPFFQRETWFGASEAKALNFATEISKNMKEDKNMVANFLNWLKTNQEPAPPADAPADAPPSNFDDAQIEQLKMMVGEMMAPLLERIAALESAIAENKKMPSDEEIANLAAENLLKKFNAATTSAPKLPTTNVADMPIELKNEKLETAWKNPFLS